METGLESAQKVFFPPHNVLPHLCLLMSYYICHLFCSSTPKVKNKSKTEIGETLGRIHLKKQNLDKMEVRRVSALRTKGHE